MLHKVGAIIDQKHAVLLLGVPADVGVALIEETIQTVKALGRVRTPGFLLVLCECKEVRIPTFKDLFRYCSYSNRGRGLGELDGSR